MGFYRVRFIRILFITVWCTALLHMTFFMAEITALNLDKNKALMENAKKLLACSSFEEETDSSSESGEGRSSAKGIDFISMNFFHSLNDNRQNSILFKYLRDEGGTHRGHSEKFSPPPDSRA